MAPTKTSTALTPLPPEPSVEEVLAWLAEQKWPVTASLVRLAVKCLKEKQRD
jgi:hypothetical protein